METTVIIRRLLASLTILGLIFLLSCEKNPNDGGHQDIHLLTLKVVDTSGHPVEGLRVGSMNYSPYIRLAKPSHTCPETQLEFSLSSPALIEMNILNYYKQIVRRLFREVKRCGDLHYILGRP